MTHAKKAAGAKSGGATPQLGPDGLKSPGDGFPLAHGPSRSRTFRLPDTLDIALDARSKKDGMSPSEIMRRALAGYLGLGPVTDE